MDGDATILEADGRAGHVEPPDLGPRHADQSTARSQSRLEVGDPAAQRARVVLAERLDVAHLEPGALHRQHHGVAHVDQLAVGEHVAADERRAAERRSADRRDRVVQQPPVGASTARSVAKYCVDLVVADVLRHADRRDRVELLARRARGSPAAGSRPGRRHPASATRCRASSACAALIVMPTTRAPWCVAAWMAIEPHPQPTSSSRAPACSCRPSLRQISSCLAACASSSVTSSARESGARVRHRRARAPGGRSRCRRRSGG